MDGFGGKPNFGWIFSAALYSAIQPAIRGIRVCGVWRACTASTPYLAPTTYERDASPTLFEWRHRLPIPSMGFSVNTIDILKCQSVKLMKDIN